MKFPQHPEMAVCGSGKSLELYNLKIPTIFCNGAITNVTPPKDSYFLYGDRFSHTKQWFKHHQPVHRLVPTFMVPFDHVLRRHISTATMDDITAGLKRHLFLGGMHSDFRHEAIQQFNPVSLEHGLRAYIFEYVNQPELGKVAQGGSVAGTGLQLAYLMGAKTIYLFGCPFNEGHEYMVTRMGEIITMLRTAGTKITIVGPSKLKGVLLGGGIELVSQGL